MGPHHSIPKPNIQPVHVVQPQSITHTIAQHTQLNNELHKPDDLTGLHELHKPDDLTGLHELHKSDDLKGLHKLHEHHENKKMLEDYLKTPEDRKHFRECHKICKNTLHPQHHYECTHVCKVMHPKNMFHSFNKSNINEHFEVESYLTTRNITILIILCILLYLYNKRNRTYFF